MRMEAYKLKLVIVHEVFLLKHTVKQNFCLKIKTKLVSTEVDIKSVLKKRCFGGISHLFFGGISQVLHRYFLKDLSRFSEQLSSRTALKCCLSSVIYKYGRLCMSFELSCIYIEIVFNENCRVFWLGKVIFVFRVLFLLLFRNLIFY